MSMTSSSMMRPGDSVPCCGDKELVAWEKVLISPKWIQSVSWDAREVVVGLTRETIKAAPEYTDESVLTRDYETGLYGYYDREGYWVDELSTV